MQGFGATLTHLVVLHHFFSGYPGFGGVVSSNPLYAERNSSMNMFELFFDRADNASDDDYATIPFRFPYDISLKSMDDGLTIQNAHELFARHYAIKQRFLSEAQDFFDSDFREALGLHFRGSDKRLEAQRVDFGAIVNTLDECIKSSGINKIFVATDEQEFLTLIQRRYGTSRVRALDCQYLSDGVTGAHFMPGSGFGKGREALLTIIILSMCKLCIRGASHLSAWAKILNPQLPVIMLGEQFYSSVFPEREILKDCVRPISNELSEQE
jgi:hypothetical protein